MKKIEVKRGDSATFDITFTDDDDVAIDLTNGTVFFTVKRKVTDTDAEAVISEESSVFEAPLTGVAIISLAPADTAELEGVYSYDVQLKDNDGNISSSDKGKFVILKDVTIRTT